MTMLCSSVLRSFFYARYRMTKTEHYPDGSKMPEFPMRWALAANGVWTYFFNVDDMLMSQQ